MKHFQLRSPDGVSFLVCEPLQRAGFTHAFSTRRGGMSPLPENALNLGYFNGDAPENVSENRRRLLQAVGATAMNIVTVKQIHSAHITTIRQAEEASSPSSRECDALITREPGLLLAVQTADCVPILIADLKHRAVAAVHAGWRGTRARIIEQTMARMRDEFDTQPKDCLAAIGPAAGVCCYEVGHDLIDQFRAEFPDAETIIANHKPNGKAHLDLPTGNAQQLQAAGLSPSRIFSSGYCTLCRNDLFFSYRRERERGVGRMLSMIGIPIHFS